MSKKIGRETVTVIRQAKVDRLSSTPSGSASEHDIEGCVIVPRASNEQDKGWVIVEGFMVAAPYDADITADDKVRVNGQIYSVDGEPGRYRNKQARDKACIFYLKRLGS